MGRQRLFRRPLILTTPAMRKDRRREAKFLIAETPLSQLRRRKRYSTRWQSTRLVTTWGRLLHRRANARLRLH